MPDWLRVVLIDAMDAEERGRVWRCLREFLADSAPADGPSLEPEVAQQPGWWRKDGRLSRFLARQAAGSPLREYVFLTFMRGGRPRRLTLAASVRPARRCKTAITAVPARARRAEARTLQRSTPAGLPEGLILAVNVVLAALVVGTFGARRGRDRGPAVEPAVPSLTQRVSEWRRTVLGPLVVLTSIVAFLALHANGVSLVENWIFTALTGVLVLTVSYLFLELGVSAEHRRRLQQLDRRLRRDAGDEGVREVLAFLRGPAPADLKRRALRLLHANLREPTPELLDALFELQHGGALDRRSKHLLGGLLKSLDRRYGNGLGPEVAR